MKNSLAVLVWILYATSVAGVIFAITPPDLTLFECFCIGGFSSWAASAMVKWVSK